MVRVNVKTKKINKYKDVRKLKLVLVKKIFSDIKLKKKVLFIIVLLYY